VEAVAAALTATPPAETLEGRAELFKVWATGGPLDIPTRTSTRFRIVPTAMPSSRYRKKIDAFKASSAFRPAACPCAERQRKPVPAVCVPSRQPGERGPTVPRQALAITTSNRKPFTDGSGRLELGAVDREC